MPGDAAAGQEYSAARAVSQCNGSGKPPSLECVLSRMCSLSNVFSLECVLSRMCSL